MIPSGFFYLAALLFGLVTGSFLNVCIWRIPRGESIVFPPSHCPACGAGIRPGDNVPLLSYLLLRGRCRSCAARISPLYPAVEALTAILFMLGIYRFGPTRALVPYLILVSAMTVITFIDLEHGIIPDRISLPGIPIGLALCLLWGIPLLDAIIGALAGGIFFYLTVVISRGGMGGGDIKLAAMMGAFLGWKLLVVAVFLALLAGSAVGVFLLATGRRGRKDPIPFGPFLALGTTIAALWGENLLRWYLHFRY